MSQDMLSTIGIKDVKELFECIDKRAKINGLNLPDPLEELDVQKKLYALSKANKTDYINFLGGGSYKRFIPSAVSAVTQRWEFLSAYTPYQAEISQGSLQAMYEFQTMMCHLTNMDASNASVYDGASACAEAIMMACRINKRSKVWISKNINPNYREVIKTYLWAGDIEITEDENAQELACKLYQFPDYYGELTDIPAKKEKELIIAAVDVVAMALIEPPDADIIVGDFQSFGLPTNFGGPYGGFVACKDAYKRNLPGRVVGKTVDAEGKTAYTLTMQAREQHIKRERATSNICSNQALCALTATVYLFLTGEKGLKKIAQTSFDNAHKLAKALENKGYEVLSKNFFNEFVLKVPDSFSNSHNTAVAAFLDKMKENNILAGIEIDKNKILICTTELNDSIDLDTFVKLC